MCKSMEDRINAAATAAATAKAKAIEFATKLIARGKQTLEEIAEDSNLPLDEVKALAEKSKTVSA